MGSAMETARRNALQPACRIHSVRIGRSILLTRRSATTRSSSTAEEGLQSAGRGIAVVAVSWANGGDGEASSLEACVLRPFRASGLCLFAEFADALMTYRLASGRLDLTVPCQSSSW